MAVVTTVLACEPECRHGLAEDFAKHYTPVIEQTVQGLGLSLSNAFANTTVPGLVSAVVPEDQLKASLVSALHVTLSDFLVGATGRTLNDGIFSVMFAEKDPFKGDCNDPKRVDRKMPPPGESWTREECKLNCHLMDYICGNPPSICHFLPLVKERIVGRIQSQLTDHALYDNGILVRSLVHNTEHAVMYALTHYGAGSLQEDPSVVHLVNTLRSHIITGLDKWVGEDVKTLCKKPTQKEVCHGWDEKIKDEILIWP
ncbi:hypothetical protein BDF14DRAFT_1876517 [Spinellus fusiger]|nr:hypothetical protein BDF14DRAFT_1876517 [Spinellus fusiger]